MKPELHKFMSRSQLMCIGDIIKEGEEKEFFQEKLKEMNERVSTMPKTYEQDGKGDEAIAYLHYFSGSCDWYILERDVEDEQLQAFGWADLGNGMAELGYISIKELTQLNVELDLHFEPTKLKDIKN